MQSRQSISKAKKEAIQFQTAQWNNKPNALTTYMGVLYVSFCFFHLKKYLDPNWFYKNLIHQRCFSAFWGYSCKKNIEENKYRSIGYRLFTLHYCILSLFSFSFFSFFPHFIFFHSHLPSFTSTPGCLLCVCEGTHQASFFPTFFNFQQ